MSYAYDAQGRRTRKTVNGITTLYVTDTDNREVLEYDGTSGQVLRWYAYGAGSNDVLNQMDVVANTRQTLIPDLQGSLLATLDSSMGALTKRGYFPYGESASVTGSFAYAGQRIDAETNGLYYACARMYAPGLGRFLQPDPIGYAGGQHLYAYVENDPLKRVDPDGLSADITQNTGRDNRTALTAGLLAIGAVVLTSPESEIALATAGLVVLGKLGYDYLFSQETTPLLSKGSTGDEEAKRRTGTNEAGNRTQHGEQRAEEAKTDPHRNVGDANRVIREGRRYIDNDTGNTVHVQGDRVVITNAEGSIVTQFRNPRANTNARMRSGRWTPTD